MKTDWLRVPLIVSLCLCSGLVGTNIAAAQSMPRTPPPDQFGTHPPEENLGYASRHPPVYPASAVHARHEGTVVVVARVGADGSVSETKIEKSSGYPELDESANENVRGMKFFPAYKDGVPTAGLARVPVNFVYPKH